MWDNGAVWGLWECAVPAPVLGQSQLTWGSSTHTHCPPWTTAVWMIALGAVSKSSSRACDSCEHQLVVLGMRSL